MVTKRIYLLCLIHFYSIRQKSIVLRIDHARLTPAQSQCTLGIHSNDNVPTE